MVVVEKKNSNIIDICKAMVGCGAADGGFWDRYVVVYKG